MYNYVRNRLNVWSLSKENCIGIRRSTKKLLIYKNKHIRYLQYVKLFLQIFHSCLEPKINTTQNTSH